MAKRKNPSKCNDSSFSQSDKQGACTYHRGVKGRITQAEYDKGDPRVRYKAGKGYKGGFAPAKRTRKTQASKEPVVEPIVFQVDKNSFNSLYKDIDYENNDILKLAILLTLSEYDIIKKSDISDTADSHSLTEVKAIASGKECLGEWENQVDSQKELEVWIEDYFKKVEGNLKEARSILDQFQDTEDIKNGIHIDGYGGYEENLTPMQFGQLKKALAKQYRFDGVIKTMKDWIVEQLNEGATVEKKNGELVTSKKINLEIIETKHPYTIYMDLPESRSFAVDGRKGYSKTAMKWALWIYNHYFDAEDPIVEEGISGLFIESKTSLRLVINNLSFDSVEITAYFQDELAMRKALTAVCYSMSFNEFMQGHYPLAISTIEDSFRGVIEHLEKTNSKDVFETWIDGLKYNLESKDLGLGYEVYDHSISDIAEKIVIYIDTNGNLAFSDSSRESEYSEKKAKLLSDLAKEEKAFFSKISKKEMKTFLKNSLKWSKISKKGVYSLSAGNWVIAEIIKQKHAKDWITFHVEGIDFGSLAEAKNYAVQNIALHKLWIEGLLEVDDEITKVVQKIPFSEQANWDDGARGFHYSGKKFLIMTDNARLEYRVLDVEQFTKNLNAIVNLFILTHFIKSHFEMVDDNTISEAVSNLDTAVQKINSSGKRTQDQLLHMIKVNLNSTINFNEYIDGELILGEITLVDRPNEFIIWDNGLQMVKKKAEVEDQQAVEKPVEEEDIVFEIDKKSFNEQYKDLKRSSKKILRKAILETLFEYDVIEESEKIDMYAFQSLDTIKGMTDSLLIAFEETASSVEELLTFVQQYFDKIDINIENIKAQNKYKVLFESGWDEDKKEIFLNTKDRENWIGEIEKEVVTNLSGEDTVFAYTVQFYFMDGDDKILMKGNDDKEERTRQFDVKGKFRGWDSNVDNKTGSKTAIEAFTKAKNWIRAHFE